MNKIPLDLDEMEEDFHINRPDMDQWNTRNTIWDNNSPLRWSFEVSYKEVINYGKEYFS